MYQCIEVNKLYFTSYEAYWKNNADDNTPRSGTNILLPPNNIIDGQTKVELQAYGVGYTLLLERHESSDDIVSLVCYNSAYYLQSPGTLKQSTTIHFNQQGPYLYGIGPLHTTGTVYRITDFAKVGNYYQFQYKNVTFHTDIEDYVSSKTYQVGDIVRRNNYFMARTNTGWTYTGETVPLYISGKGSDLFAYFSYIVAKYDTYVIDEGYTYDYGTSIKNTYTLSEINTIKNKSVVSSDGDFKLRVNNNYSCWEIIKSIGAQSNRWPFFYDKAYFVDYVSDNTTRDTITQMDIDYGVDSNGLSKTRYTRTPEGSTPNYEYIDLYTIVKNADQGSEYVQTSQTVFQETYNATISISNATNASEGYSLYFPYPESNPDDTTINNNDRNLTIRKIAFNRVVQNYKPSDAVQIQFSEVGSGNNIVAIGTYAKASDLPTTGIDIGAYALVMKDNIFQEYYRFNGSVWAKLDSYGDTTNGIYVQKFQPYTLVKSINDVQNGLNLTNVALACVELIWPSCITQITFGNPEFMDAQRQWKSLSLEAQISTIQGSEGSLFSDRYASKLVIGNQNMSDLQDNRQGFTGLIIEKNYDNELYRLSGYNNGKLQAYFNSQGEIMSGDGSVIINENGISIGEGSGQNNSVISIQDWDSSKSYTQGTLTVYERKTYVALQDNYNVAPNSDPTVWQQLTFEPSSTDVPVWQQQAYDAGAMVRYGNPSKTYIALQQTTQSDVPGTSSKWQQLTYEGTDTNIPVWSQDATYPKGQLVLYVDSQGKSTTYVSLEDNNTTTPGTDSTKWQLLTYDLSATSVWSPQKHYAQNDVVTWNGKIYKSLKSDGNSNREPGSQQGSEFWTLVGSTNLWTPTETYVQGDTVLHNGFLYIAKPNANTNFNREPGQQGGQDYWELTSTDTSSLIGSIIAQNNSILSTQGGGSTRIDSNGLQTYNSNGVKVCSVDTNGNIIGISINASQISSGYISSDRINSASISAQEINASKITSGTIDARVVNVQNINGSNITSGTISADRIDTSSLVVGGTVKPWAQNTAYKKDDLMMLDGIIYVSLQQHTSEAEFNFVEASKWSLQTQGGLWHNNIVYHTGDVVCYNGVTYVQTYQGTSYNKAPGTQEGQGYWTSYQAQSGVAEFASVQAYDSTVQYEDGISVVYDGKVYISKNMDGQAGHTPSASSTYWDCVQDSQIHQDSQDNQTTQDTQGSATTSGFQDYAGIGIVRIDEGGLQTYDMSYNSIQQYRPTSTYASGSKVLYGGHQYTQRRYVPKNTYPSSSTYWTDNGVVAQCTVGTNGQIIAGEGVIGLGQSGLNIISNDTDTDRQIKFVQEDSTNNQYSKIRYYSGVYTTKQKLSLGVWGTKTSNSNIAISLSAFKQGSETSVNSEIDICPQCTPQITIKNTSQIDGDLSGATSFIGRLLGITESFTGQTSFGQTNVGKITLSNGMKVYFGIDTTHTSQNVNSVTFQASSGDTSGYGFTSNTSIVYAQCSSIRSTQSNDGSDYVANVKWNGMDCRHEQGNGFYWIAIGW